MLSMAAAGNGNLMPDVGTVAITTNEESLSELISLRLDRWLTENNWRKSVDVDRKVCSEAKIEISFVPGEFQSNGPRVFQFTGEPDLIQIEQELAKWLHQLA